LCSYVNIKFIEINGTSMKKIILMAIALLTVMTNAFAQLGSLSSDLVFTPVTPCRIIDTRNVAAGILTAGASRGFMGWNGNYTAQGGGVTSCNLPFSTNNAAIVVNFTVVSPTTGGYITVFPGDATSVPLAATLNFNAGDIKGNNAVLKLNQTGTGANFGIYTTSTTHIVADVVGYYAKPVAVPMVSLSSDLVFTPVTPCRMIDTRSASAGILVAGTTRGFYGWGQGSFGFLAQGGSNTGCGIPQGTNTAAIVVNFTSVSPQTGGYMTAYPGDATQPLAATLNFNAGNIKGNNAVLKLNQTNSGNHFNVYTTSTMHLVGDVVGYYAKPLTAPATVVPLGMMGADLVYTPVTPCRIMDTRSSAAGIMAAGSQRGFSGWNGNYTAQGGSASNCGLPFSYNNAALVVNFTVVSPTTGGYITAYPGNAASVPLAATLNFDAGDVKGNNTVLKLNQTGTGADFGIYTTSTTHIVADVVGYYAKVKPAVSLGASFQAAGANDLTQCVFDSATGLTWEGKPASGFRANTNTFTNYDNTTTLQKRIPGAPDTFAMPTLAEVNAATNSMGYVAAVNAAALCGYTNWRMPTKAELLTINIVANGGLGNNGSGGGIDGDVTAWFPNTINGMTWTSTPYPNGVEDAANMVNFGASSGHFGWSRNSPFKVRLVR
jgi:Protein of unknown function (DUF1566)